MRNLNSLAGFLLEAMFGEYLMQHMSVLWAGQVKHPAGAGPRMRNSGRGVVIADYLVAGNAVQGWIDCKAKSTIGRRVDLNRMEHMIDAKAWDNYMKLFQTGTQVYLVILEIETHGIFMGHLYNIATSGQPKSDVLNGTPVKRFDRRSLTHIGNFTIPDDDLRRVQFSIRWDVVKAMMIQLPLFPDHLATDTMEAHHA